MSSKRSIGREGFIGKNHHAIAVSVMLLSWFVFVNPILFSSASLWRIDLVPQDIPERVSAARAVLSGEWPTWNPYLMCGYPQLDSSHSGILYPLSAIFLLFPSSKGNDIFLAIHDLMFCIFMYIYIFRRLKSSASACFGAVFAMSSESWRLCHGMSMATPSIVYLPLALYLIELMADGSKRATKLLVIVNSILMTPGAPNNTIIVYITEVIYFLFLTFNQTPLLQIIKRSFAIVVGGVILASIQFIPILVYFLNSNRHEFVDRAAVAERFLPMAFAFLPSWFQAAGIEEVSVWYAWIRFAFIVGLALLGLLTRAAWFPRGFWPITILLSYLLATGFWIFRYAEYLPVLNIFKWPVVYLIPGVIGVFMLMAAGSSQLLLMLTTWKAKLGAAIGWAGVTSLSLFAASHDLSPMAVSFDVYEDADSAIVTALSNNPTTRLWNYQKNFVGAVNLKIVEENVRSLSPNSNLMHNVAVLDQLELNDTVSPLRIDAFMRLKDRAPGQWTKLLRLAGITHVAGAVASPIGEVTPITEEGVYFYRLNNPLGRAWLVQRVEQFSDRKQVAGRLLEEDFDPSQTVAIEVENPVDWTNGDRSLNGSVRYDSKSWKESVVYVTAEADSFLVIADAYWPFVRAWVDGKPTTVYPANLAFRAIRVDQGKHEIIVRVVPTEFYLGLAVTLIASLWLICWRPAPLGAGLQS